MRFVLLGTVLKSKHFHYNLAANPASSKWLMGFLDGLANVTTEIRLCGHCYSRAWPRGPIFPGKKKYLWDVYDNNLVQFINLPGVRLYSLARSYFKVANTMIRKNPVDAILTYNPYPWNVTAARRLRAKYNVPWICLNLDFDNVGEGWKRFKKFAGDADAHLFLSHWGYENAPAKHKIHLDSGVSALSASFGKCSDSEPLTIVYLGKLGKSGGLEILLKVPELIADKNIRFVYGGKGYPDADLKLKALAQRDSRVQYLGFVEESEISGLFDRAAIFLNPRDPEQVVNDMVFPSKIMEYLKHGKTVVSTWTKGLDPVYRDLMLISESPRVEDFTAALQNAINESFQERVARSNRIRAFLEDSRLWTTQAHRFVDFASQFIASR